MVQLRRGSRDLTEYRDWCEEQAADYRNSYADRRLWRMLADEATARLGDRKDHTDTELWESD